MQIAGGLERTRVQTCKPANPANLYLQSDARRILRSPPPHCEMRRKDPFFLWGSAPTALTAVLTVPEYYGKPVRFVARLGVRLPRSLAQRQQLRRPHAHKSAESHAGACRHVADGY
jgi:hypothetical protein